MKFLFRLLPLLAAMFALASVRAAETPPKPAAALSAELLGALTAADEERVAAFVAGDRARLEAILSDGLHYAHSGGRIDSKASMIETLALRRTVYEGFDYRERTFVSVAAGVATMAGRVNVRVRTGDQPLALDLNFLAVWREEHGRWRFLAWQSCRSPAPPAPAPAKP